MIITTTHLGSAILFRTHASADRNFSQTMSVIEET